MLYTDECSIINVVTSEQFGETSETEVIGIKCRDEINDKGTSGQNGDITSYKRLYILPPNTVVQIGDSIKTTKERGAVVTNSYSKIDEVFKIGGYSAHHIEVYIL